MLKKSVLLPYLTFSPLKWMEKLDPCIFSEATQRMSLASEPDYLILLMNLSRVEISREEYYLKMRSLVRVSITGASSCYIIIGCWNSFIYFRIFDGEIRSDFIRF